MSFFKLCGLGIKSEIISKFYVLTAVIILTLNIWTLLSSLSSASTTEELSEMMHYVVLFAAICNAVVAIEIMKTPIMDIIEGLGNLFVYSRVPTQMEHKLKQDAANKVYKVQLIFGFSMVILFLSTVGNALVELVISLSYADGDYPTIFPCTFQFTSMSKLNYALILSLQIGVMSCSCLFILGYIVLIVSCSIWIEANVKQFNHEISGIIYRARTIHGSFTKSIFAADYKLTGLKNNYNEKSEQEKLIRFCLKECIQHHLSIMELFNHARYLLRILTVNIFIASVGIICTSAVQLAVGKRNLANLAKFGSFLSAELLHVFLYCWSGERIIGASESLREAVYLSRWYDFPKNCQSSLRIIMARSVKGLRLNAITGQSLCFATFADVINLSYSFFNLILASRKKLNL